MVSFAEAFPVLARDGGTFGTPCKQGCLIACKGWQWKLFFPNFDDPHFFHQINLFDEVFH